MRPYPAYKDSGVEWIGEVPEGWEIIKLKYLARKIGSGITPKGGASVYQTDGIPFIRSQNVQFDGLTMNGIVDAIRADILALEDDLTKIGPVFCKPVLVAGDDTRSTQETTRAEKTGPISSAAGDN